MGTLTTKMNTRIPIPLDEEEEAQLRKTLQRNTMERQATNVSYLENVGLSGLEQQ